MNQNHQSKRFVLASAKIWFFLVLVLGTLFLSYPTQAWQSRHTGKRSSNVKVLNKGQQKNIAHRLVAKMLHDDFFEKTDLPNRFVLASLALHGNDLGMTRQQFTDMVLNTMLVHPKVLIVNQDLKTDLSMDFQLMDYLPATEIRMKGILLGADYYISGGLKSEVVTQENGRLQKLYTAYLIVRDIRSNKQIVKVSSDFSKQNLKKKN